MQKFGSIEMRTTTLACGSGSGVSESVDIHTSISRYMPLE